MTSVLSDSGTSSESASSDESSTTSSVPVSMEPPLMRPPNAYLGSSSLRRSSIELRLITQANESLISCIDAYRPKMASSQTAYFYSLGETLTQQAIQKKTMRSLRNTNLDRTLTNMMSDSGSMVGSAVAAGHPYGARYAPSVNQTLQAPSVISEMPPVYFPPTRQFPPDPTPTASSHSSGYHSNELPNDSFCFKVDPLPKQRSRPHTTLMQAISEAEGDEVEEEPDVTSRSRKDATRKKGNSNQQSKKTDRDRSKLSQEARPRSSTEGRKRQKSKHSSSDSDSDESDAPSPPKLAKTKPKEKARTSLNGKERQRQHSKHSESEESDTPSPPKLAKTKPKAKARTSSNGKERQRQHSKHSESEESDAPSPPKSAKSEPKRKPKSKTSVTKVIKLREWRLRVVGEELVIAGYLPDRSRAISGTIKRYSHPVIVAENGEYTVDGPPYIGSTAPKYLESYCKNGFPRQWRALTKKWIADISAKEKKKSTPQVKNHKNESKASNQGSTKRPKPAKPRPSASSTPIASEKTGETSSASKPRKRLSKSMDKSTSKRSENQKKVVKPRHKSEEREEKKSKPVRPPAKELESEESESASESESFAKEPPKPKKPAAKDNKVTEPKKKDLSTRPKESKVQTKKVATKDNTAAANPKPSSSKQAVEEERRVQHRLFDDDSSGEDNEEYVMDPFANIGGDERISLGKMTPNALMKSIEAGELDLGRHTPPMQRIQHLFDSGTKSLASTGGSPSSLNTSRDNPVAKRMNKDLEGKKPKPKKKAPTADAENRDPRLDEAYKFLKPSSHNLNMRTPTIIKKGFRHQPSESGTDLDEDLDESLAF